MRCIALSISIVTSIALLVGAFAPNALALDPKKTITQFKHQSWGAADGIDTVSSIAQTQDGYIWIGTGTGLFRFDGVAFTRWAPKPGDPDPQGLGWTMLGSKDGSLWVSSANGVLQLKDGVSRLWTLDDGSLQHVRRIYEARDGRSGLRVFASRGSLTANSKPSSR